jgi:hypothetical protein
MQLIQINTKPAQFIITPTNQPLPTPQQLQTLLNTTNYTITTQTTNSTYNQREFTSDTKSNATIISSKTINQPIQTHIITLN